MKPGIAAFLRPLCAVILGLSLGLAVSAMAGEDPLKVAKLLWSGAFGTAYDLGMTLYYATPLIFTGLATAIPLHAGLFNIGAEGQLNIGAMAAALAGILLPHVPMPLAPLLAGLAACAGGALWGGIAGWMRARRGSHEVITTIMLNFIAAGIVSWITVRLLQNPDSQNPETVGVGAGYLLPNFPVFDGAPVGTALPLALLVACACWVLLWRTPFGFELRAVGASEEAAKLAGIPPGRTRFLAFLLAGGLAGLVGISEVLGNAGRFKLGFSPDFGFIGIAVALLGRRHPFGIVLAALLFGALQNGGNLLDLETTHVTRDLATVMQALVILCVGAEGLWAWMDKRAGRTA